MSDSTHVENISFRFRIETGYFASNSEGVVIDDFSLQVRSPLAIVSDSSLNLRENLPIDTQIHQVEINDDNSKAGYTYSLTEDTNTFSIDSSTGAIRLTTPLNFESGTTSYDLQVSISDNATPNPRTTTQTITVEVEDVIDEVAPETPSIMLEDDTGESESDNITKDFTITGSGIAPDFMEFQISVDGTNTWVSVPNPASKSNGDRFFNGQFYIDEVGLNSKLVPTEKIEFTSYSQFQRVSDQDNFLEESSTLPDLFYFDITTPSNLASGNQNGTLLEAGSNGSNGKNCIYIDGSDLKDQ